MDIDKLKALHEAATPGPWESVAVTGHANFSQIVARLPDGLKCVSTDIDDAEGVITAFLRNAVPEIIAQSERLARYEEALRPFAEIAEGEVWDRFIADSKMNLRISNGDGSRHYAFINAECFEQARQALGDTQ